MPESVTCPNCDIPIVRKPSKFKENVFWWGCPNWPACPATAAEHPDGTLASTPATKEVKELRQTAHREAERIWGLWSNTSSGQKRKMYVWLKENSKSGHFGLMDKEELIEVIQKLKDMQG